MGQSMDIPDGMSSGQSLQDVPIMSLYRGTYKGQT